MLVDLLVELVQGELVQASRRELKRARRGGAGDRGQWLGEATGQGTTYTTSHPLMVQLLQLQLTTSLSPFSNATCVNL